MTTQDLTVGGLTSVVMVALFAPIWIIRRHGGKTPRWLKNVGRFLGTINTLMFVGAFLFILISVIYLMSKSR